MTHLAQPATSTGQVLAGARTRGRSPAPAGTAGAAGPRLVVLGGSLHPRSRTNRLADWCARRVAEDYHAEVSVFSGPDLAFPFYQRDRGYDERVDAYLSALAACDGVVLLTPAYHGALSGLLKNALDYVNDLDKDPRPYLDGRAIGCVTLSSGHQSGMSTLSCLRAIAHALRAWPTPLGVVLSATAADLALDGAPASEHGKAHISTMFSQIFALAASNATASAARMEDC
jgi:FMN reductase